jgi:quercetin dioxygenase-like cupin family protein
MKTWQTNELDVKPHAPEILSTTDETRAIAIDLPSGESLQEHEVHEQAWVVVVSGEVEVSTAAGESVSGGPGLLVEFPPRERHRVEARSDARLLLLLAPWPGDGHPGAVSDEQRATVRERAAEKSGGE